MVVYKVNLKLTVEFKRNWIILLLLKKKSIEIILVLVNERIKNCLFDYLVKKLKRKTTQNKLWTRDLVFYEQWKPFTKNLNRIIWPKVK
jgi:hypothetical protein